MLDVRCHRSRWQRTIYLGHRETNACRRGAIGIPPVAISALRQTTARMARDRHLAVAAPRLARIVDDCCYPRSRTFEGHDRRRRRGFVTQLGFWGASAVDQSATSGPPMKSPPRLLAAR